MWSIVDPLQASLKVRPEIQRLFASLDELNGLVD